jgi:hypothetical protein
MHLLELLDSNTMPWSQVRSLACMSDADAVFSNRKKEDVVSWTAMIAGMLSMVTAKVHLKCLSKCAMLG